ncbi:Lrp/AsnC family transcriptional regulator [Acidaminobacter hydrogenoformans]|uniref:Lrp/AsnC family transcriptional regulator, leucine-responsive regulatory protein n=1 Tax=Acidaminobacter hydrogenoformans DSM 2784 TaxID=1120920 RepID=A0A1G5S0J0_9FIRM|nr:Lrp/AsnC family transcriptional regulator [Acidaminobacter hydrogenoformans]SCZ79628.1 Lrp/AsnC family transcriptional regulator, leucine-responsive regulatory protein [Acidaminobacter hydrogenoformans DSM 2784]
MDNLDLKILELLEHNGRLTHEEIGKRLNLSRPAIHQRISKLEASGIIKGYSAEIDWGAAGQGIRAFVFMNVKTTDFNDIMQRVMSIQVKGLKIEKCYRITGQWCMMLRIRASVTDQMTQLHDALLKIEGMLETFTMLILTESLQPEQAKEEV